MATVDPTAPAEAQSLASIAHQAEALTESVESLRAAIRRALTEHPAAVVTVEPAEARPSSCHPIDRTDNRLRAYVAAVRPLRGVVYEDDIDAAIQRGRSLIERLALSAEGTGMPRLRLTAEQAADVLAFASNVEPVDPVNWHIEPDGEPSHVVGLSLLLEALEESLRNIAERQPIAAQGSAEGPGASEGADLPAPAATSRPEPGEPPEVRHVYLECALRHLRCADSLLADGKPATAEMEDVAEVIRSAAENLTTWLDGVADSVPHEAYVFDALDACTVATALIEAGLNPRNSKTISPIKGVLRLGAGRLAEVAETEGRSGREAIRAAGTREARP